MVCLEVRVDFRPKLKALSTFWEILVFRKNKQQEMKTLFLTSILHLQGGHWFSSKKFQYNPVYFPVYWAKFQYSNFFSPVYSSIFSKFSLLLKQIFFKKFRENSSIIQYIVHTLLLFLPPNLTPHLVTAFEGDSPPPFSSIALFTVQNVLPKHTYTIVCCEVTIKLLQHYKICVCALN